MRSQATTMGLNKTGIRTSPIDSEDIVRSAEQGSPSAMCDGESMAKLRKEYETEAEPVGTVPIPSSLKGVVQAAVDMIKGRATTSFVDRLGERLSFERTAVRFYQALLTKFDTSEPWAGGPTRKELEHFCDEELEHFEMLKTTMTELGADPTAETPAADVMGVASSGLLQVISDPRTTLVQSLSALLTAELTDNEGWQTLIALSHSVDKENLVPRLELAQKQEAEHLVCVRRWVLSEAGIMPAS